MVPAHALSAGERRLVMLSLTREVGQKILIGDDIVVTVIAVTSNGRVKIGIDAPRQVRIDREEVLERIRHENVESAETTPDTAAWTSFARSRTNNVAATEE